ncbi:hypothetical protein EW146_g6992 [Bondarzewia mesenterica]|uniref:ATP-dependent DNA helicase II subunit 2 n=1 Tax=Bondarzewia mesenterica TaxID=1095465 RepID=A0A4S4LNV5_9AGAM|nr:hypothetical protein EW146_g6992 [Bondarzewia mesenterica]
MSIYGTPRDAFLSPAATMPAERAGYTVTMFLVDVSPSMGTLRTVEFPDGPNGESQSQSTEMTHLEWALQFVMLKIQEMIFNGRKTDQCGVILFGTDGTKNVINEKSGGYENVSEYIPIGQPNAGTLAKLAALRASEDIVGDPIDAIIVGIQTQDNYLSNKRTWTRKMVLLTDGENPIEVEDWETIVGKMTGLNISFTIVGIDFNDEEFGFEQEDKSNVKRENEVFFHKFVDDLPNSVIGTLDFALQEVSRPEIKQTKSALLGTVLRLGDLDPYPLDSLEIHVKSKHMADDRTEEGNEDERSEGKMDEWVELTMQTEYVIEKNADKSKEEDEEEMDDEGDEQKSVSAKKDVEKVEKEELVRGFKYGSTYVPCPDGQFERLPTRRGIEICGFFKAVGFRREYPMGEVQYIWADNVSAKEQIALSSLVQAMYKENMYAIARWVTRDGIDPKMGVLAPCQFDKVDCFLWAQMPFADDIRKYTFAPLENLINKKGERVTKHPYIPTDEQLDAMENFVDAMDLMEAGEKNEEGKREAWFDTRMSYNPSIHRVKQAMFHSAVVQDLVASPLPPPHPELLKYFEPPKRVLKRARDAIEECQSAFKVKEVPKKIARARKDGHVHAKDAEDEVLLLDRMPARPRQLTQSQSKVIPTYGARVTRLDMSKKDADSDTEIESDDGDAELLFANKSANKREGTTGMTSADKELPTPSPEPEMDYGREPGRIVSTTTPLNDFRKNISRGDVVTKAVEDLAWAIREVVMRPFAGRRYREMHECMTELREVCLQEDEIDSWNSFLKGLKEACLADLGNLEFWKEVKKQGRKASLIGDSEARAQGGKSDISDAAADEFLA